MTEAENVRLYVPFESHEESDALVCDEGQAAVDKLGLDVPSQPVQGERSIVAVNAEAVMARLDQSNGFKTPEAYQKAALAGNAKTRLEANQYISSALPTILYAHSPTDMPHGLICCTCSDGRIGGTEMTSRNPTLRFPIRARPIAGNKMFPDVNALIDDEKTGIPLAQRLDALLNDEATKQRLFDQAEALFGGDITRYTTRARAVTYAGKKVFDLPVPDMETLPSKVKALAATLQLASGTALREQATKNQLLIEKLRRMGDTFPTTIEIQSHSAFGRDDHGCGAHGNIQKALTTAAIDALILEQFIRERYPEEADNIHIALTHHLTGEEGEVLDAHKPDLLRRVDPSIASMIDDGCFRPLFQRDRKHGIVRREKINFSGIDKERHSEYIILVSEHIKAHLINGESVLEQCMLPDLNQMEGTVMMLLGIAKKNRFARENGQQPLFLHLDEPETNQELARRYDELYVRLSERPDIKAMIAEGKLYVIRSSSRPLSFSDKNRLRVTFKH